MTPEALIDVAQDYWKAGDSQAAAAAALLAVALMLQEIRTLPTIRLMRGDVPR